MFHFENETLVISYLQSGSELIYIVDFGPSRGCALNMGYIYKWPLRMKRFFQN